MQEFNQEILETMQKQIKNIKSVYEICDYCKKGNQLANEIYLKKYPTHKDLLYLIERSVSILNENILNNFNQYIVENLLHDIEFFIGQNILIESHVKRLLLSSMTLQSLPLFKKKIEPIREQLTNIYNCELNNYFYQYDEMKAELPFNYQQLESYMRYNKVGYEEELIDGEFNGDYVTESSTMNVLEDKFNTVHEKYCTLSNINIIDKFILEQHGIKPIIEYNDCYVHNINNIQYNVYKNNGYYYLITEINNRFKSYKLTIHENVSNITIESIYGGK